MSGCTKVLSLNLFHSQLAKKRSTNLFLEPKLVSPGGVASSGDHGMG